MQVNPHTHQLKLCDFGSAKVLVSQNYHSEYSWRFWTLFNCWMCNIHSFVGKGRTKHFIHMFSVLSSSRAHLRSCSLLNSNWYLVFRLCVGGASSRAGINAKMKQGLILAFISLSQIKLCIVPSGVWNIRINDEDLVKGLFFSLSWVALKILFFWVWQPLFPGESGVDQLVEIIKVSIFIMSEPWKW